MLHIVYIVFVQKWIACICILLWILSDSRSSHIVHMWWPIWYPSYDLYQLFFLYHKEILGSKCLNYSRIKNVGLIRRIYKVGKWFWGWSLNASKIKTGKRKKCWNIFYFHTVLQWLQRSTAVIKVKNWKIRTHLNIRTNRRDYILVLSGRYGCKEPFLEDQNEVETKHGIIRSILSLKTETTQPRHERRHNLLNRLGSKSWIRVLKLTLLWTRKVLLEKPCSLK